MVAQDLHQTEPVNSLAEREEGFTSLLTEEWWAGDGFWGSVFKAMDPARLTMTVSSPCPGVYGDNKMELVGY